MKKERYLILNQFAGEPLLNVTIYRFIADDTITSYGLHRCFAWDFIQQAWL